MLADHRAVFQQAFWMTVLHAENLHAIDLKNLVIRRPGKEVCQRVWAAKLLGAFPFGYFLTPGKCLAYT